VFGHRQRPEERAIAAQRRAIARELRRIGVHDLKLYGTGGVVQPLAGGKWGQPRSLADAAALLSEMPEGASRTQILAAWNAAADGSAASEGFAERWSRQGRSRANRAESL